MRGNGQAVLPRPVSSILQQAPGDQDLQWKQWRGVRGSLGPMQKGQVLQRLGLTSHSCP